MATAANHMNEMTLIDQAERQLEIAREYTITSDEGLVKADVDLKEVKSLAKQLDEARKDEKRPHDEAAKAVQEKYKQPLEFLSQAERLLKNAIVSYQDEVAERQRKAAEEEAKRIERNAERRAATAEKHGDTDRAEEIRLEAEMEAAAAATTMVNDTAPKVGVSTRDNWKAECTDLLALVKAVAAGAAPVTLLCMDQKAADKYAKAVKDAAPVPGIRFYNDKVIASR